MIAVLITKTSSNIFRVTYINLYTDAYQSIGHVGGRVRPTDRPAGGDIVSIPKRTGRLRDVVIDFVRHVITRRITRYWLIAAVRQSAI